MRRLFCLSLLLLLFSLPLLAGTITKTVTFQENDLIFWQVNGYDVVELRGYPALIEPGSPRLPRVVIPLCIPAGTSPTHVEIISLDITDLEGTYTLYPAQPDIPLPMPGKNFIPEQEIPQNPDIYNSHTPFPEHSIAIKGAGSKSGYRIAHIELFPLRYIPAEGKLRFAKRVTYRVTYEPDANRAGLIATERQKKIFGNDVRSFVANPLDVEPFAPRVSNEWKPSFVPPGYYEYVVVTEDPMDTVFQRLVDWKTKKGYPATVVLVSWIESNYTGYDTPEKIRNFIIDANANWGTFYVLLGGSGDQRSSGQNIVPARRAWYTYAGGGNIDTLPADLYFADLDGTWDGDGDHTYGEIGDNVDMYSDIYVGRASVYSISMAQNFVYKTLTYEFNPPTEFIKRLMLPTAILWSSYEERPIQDSVARMAPGDWRVSKMYERNGTLSRQGMIDTMNVGYNLGHWEGHGDENGIYMGSPYLTSSDADGLINGDKVGIANSIACHCGGWDLNPPGGDCFAEHLVNRVGGGLCVAIMNGRYGWGAYVGGYVPGPSERLDTTFYYNLFVSDIYHVGQTHAVAKDAWVFYADSGNQYDMTRWCIYELNLFGCPEMPILTDIPLNLNVAFPASIPVGDQNVDVTVTSGGNPVENGLVCLNKDGETYATGYTNASGFASINVYPTSPGNMDITVTAQNHYPFEDTIVVILASGPYIAFQKGIIDDSGGNNNGRINPGETIDLTPWAKNIGADPAYGVYAYLDESDQYVSITSDTSYFGTISEDDSASGAPDYTFNITTDCPNGHALIFDFEAHDNNDTVWTNHPSYTVYAPVLTLNGFVVDPNGDQRLDPGETADLVVTIDNDGGEDAISVTGFLYESNAYITVTDPDGSFGDIMAGTSGDNASDPFSVQAAGNTPTGETVTFYLEVTSGVYCDTLSFSLTVGAKHYFVWDPDPDHSSGPAIDVALQACGFVGDYNYSLPVTALDEYLAVFVCVGIYSNNFVIDAGSAEATALVNFVNAGGRMYLEGGDVWYWDPPYNNGYDFGPLFGINADDDGTDDLATVQGQGGTFTVGMSFTYNGENNYIDHINPTGSGFLIFRNSSPSYNCGVANDAGSYRTVGTSWEFSGLVDGSPPSTKAALADSIMHFFGIFVGVEEEVVGMSLPKVYGLSQSYPNPCGSHAFIKYQVPRKSSVDLRVYDASGRLVEVVVDGEVAAGYHSTRLDTKSYVSGVYFYRLASGNKVFTKKLIVVK